MNNVAPRINDIFFAKSYQKAKEDNKELISICEIIKENAENGDVFCDFKESLPQIDILDKILSLGYDVYYNYEDDNPAYAISWENATSFSDVNNHFCINAHDALKMTNYAVEKKLEIVYDWISKKAALNEEDSVLINLNISKYANEPTPGTEVDLNRWADPDYKYETYKDIYPFNSNNHEFPNRCIREISKELIRNGYYVELLTHVINNEHLEIKLYSKTMPTFKEMEDNLKTLEEQYRIYSKNSKIGEQELRALQEERIREKNDSYSYF